MSLFLDYKTTGVITQYVSHGSHLRRLSCGSTSGSGCKSLHPRWLSEWPTGKGLWHICLVLGRIQYLSCIFLGDTFIWSNQPGCYSCNLFFFVSLLPPHPLLSSPHSSRCGFRTEEPNSAGMREPCWPIKMLPSSNPTQGT